MPGLIRSLRARSLNAFAAAAMLLAFVALTAVGLESVSFGHQHVAGGHSLHHHHVFFESHEHPGTHPDDPDHDRRAPAPHHRDAPQRTVTVSAAPALAQPIGISLPAAPRAEPAPVGPALELAPVARPVSRLLPPRAPPIPRSPLRVS
jgi:hypothetical protein